MAWTVLATEEEIDPFVPRGSSCHDRSHSRSSHDGDGGCGSNIHVNLTVNSITVEDSEEVATTMTTTAVTRRQNGQRR